VQGLGECVVAGHRVVLVGNQLFWRWGR
jgi:hypothetical protein